MTEDPKMTRREFLRNGGRWALALLVGGGAAYLGTREDRETCINNSLCRGCGRLRGCHLPAAVSTRAAMKEEQSDA